MRNHPNSDTSTTGAEDATKCQGEKTHADLAGKEAAARARAMAAITLVEDVKKRLVEIEALAHAAAEAVGRMAFAPWPTDAAERERRVNAGRVPFLIETTAETAHQALLECVEGLRAWAA